MKGYKRYVPALALAGAMGCGAQAWQAPAKAEQDLTVLATANYTTPSLGEFHSDIVIQQSNRTSAGGAVGYEVWKHGNGFVAEYSVTPTDGRLSALNPDFTFPLAVSWKLARNKLDMMYEHRFRSRAKIQPYLGGGAFVVVTWGGNAPARSNVNATGFDGWGGEITTAGFTTRLSRRVALKTGLNVNVGKACTYGDTTYRASQNLMFEPQAGLAFRLGKTGR